MYKSASTGGRGLGTSAVTKCHFISVGNATFLVQSTLVSSKQAQGTTSSTSLTLSIIQQVQGLADCSLKLVAERSIVEVAHVANRQPQKKRPRPDNEEHKRSGRFQSGAGPCSSQTSYEPLCRANSCSCPNFTRCPDGRRVLVFATVQRDCY